MPDPRQSNQSSAVLVIDRALTRLRLDDPRGQALSSSASPARSRPPGAAALAALGPPPPAPPTLSAHPVCPCHGPSPSRFKEMRLRLQAPRRPTLQRQHAVLSVRDLGLPDSSARNGTPAAGHQLVRGRHLYRSGWNSHPATATADTRGDASEPPNEMTPRLSVVTAAQRRAFRGPY
ncbi:hypothetical protein ATCC90586_005470 [Pythium insidiosum]|nr:hypothetical protein ATCC90586_005470 [Pythium insidiosum]